MVEKLGISLDDAKLAAAAMSWTIPDEHLVKRETRRGRPKSAAVSDTESETSTTSSKKKRGRPAKKIASPEPTTQKDQIAQLIAEAYDDSV